jgi:hypothetical protein
MPKQETAERRHESIEPQPGIDSSRLLAADPSRPSTWPQPTPRRKGPTFPPGGSRQRPPRGSGRPLGRASGRSRSQVRRAPGDPVVFVRDRLDGPSRGHVGRSHDVKLHRSDGEGASSSSASRLADAARSRKTLQDSARLPSYCGPWNHKSRSSSQRWRCGCGRSWRPGRGRVRFGTEQRLKSASAEDYPEAKRRLDFIVRNAGDRLYDIKCPGGHYTLKTAPEITRAIRRTAADQVSLA